MYSIKTIAIVKLHTGILCLTDEQAKPRMHLLTPIEDEPGCYEIKSMVTFKAGESFGYDGEIKGISNRVIDSETEKLMSEVLLEEKIAARAESVESPSDEVEESIEEIEVSEKIDTIIDAIYLLEDGNSAHWTNSGLPEIAALKEFSKLESISADERNEAFQVFQDNGND